MNDAELVNRILAGEERLFAELVGRYAGCVWAICSAHIFNRTDCEDVAQDVFVQCYLRLGTLRRPAAFGLWLSQIARRRCRDWLRAASRRKAAMTRFEEHARHDGVRAAAEDGRRVEQVELHGTIDALVHTLPPKTRETMLLCYGEGYSPAQAAKLLGISHDAVKKRLRYGRKLLAAKVGDEIEPALAAKRHTEDFTRAALAAIPFGSAAWLGTAGAGTGAAAASKLATIGGSAIMANKVIVTTGVVVLLLLALTYGIYTGIGSRDSEELSNVTPETAQVVRESPGTGQDRSQTEQIDTRPVAQGEGSQDDKPGERKQEEASEPITLASLLAEKLKEEEAAKEDEEQLPAVISGIVTDSEAYPFSGASIRVEVSTDDAGQRVRRVYETNTDSDGQYEIAGIDTSGFLGFGTVYASAKGYKMQKRSGLRLSSGNQYNDIDFMLLKSRYSVSGEVVSEQGRPIRGASINLRHYGYDEEGLWQMVEEGRSSAGSISGEAKFAFAFTDETGRFEIVVQTEGLCDFTVIKEGYGPGFFSQIPTGTENARFIMRSAGAISGRVTASKGTPVRVDVSAQGRAYPGGLTPATHQLQGLAIVTVDTSTDAEGAYLLESLGADYHYNVAVFQEGRHVAGKEGIRVDPGKTTQGVDFVLRPSARVYGRITDATSGDPVYHLGVWFRMVGPDGSTSPTMVGWAETSPDGRYTEELIAEETGRVQVGASYCHPCGTNETVGGEPPPVFDLQPGSEIEVNFTVDAPFTIPIRVEDENGDPMEGVWITLKDVQANLTWSNDRVLTDSEGRFEWYGMTPGRTYAAGAIDITRAGQSWLGGIEPITGGPGETVPEVVIVVEAKGGIEGFILDADGSPVALAQIECRAVSEDGSLSPIQRGGTDEQGVFCVLRALPEGVHPTVLVGRQTENGYDVGIIENIEIVANGVTDVGIIQLGQHLTSLEEAAQQLGEK